mmetsp:Transcript_8694/g.27315  ORF Transcript_8694/g.27315 Transcript_8694/m.27315 type:complete len:231 (+) Transcript_8694:368-1060(+)
MRKMEDIPPPFPEPPTPPIDRITYSQDPTMSRVGRNLAPSAIQFVSFTYCTGMKSRGSTPRARCAASSFRSKISTDPIAKWYDGAACVVPTMRGYRCSFCPSVAAASSSNESVFSDDATRFGDTDGRRITSATLLFVTIIRSTSPDSSSTVANSCQLISVPPVSRDDSHAPSSPSAANVDTMRGPTGSLLLLLLFPFPFGPPDVDRFFSPPPPLQPFFPLSAALPSFFGP